MMLTDTFIYKTFLDDFGLNISSGRVGTFFSLKFPALTGIIKFGKTGKDLEIIFDSKTLQKEFEQKREGKCLEITINSREVLRSYSEVIRELIEKNGERLTAERLEEERFSDEPMETETVRETKKRLGQQKYRERLEDLWEGSCAVTGITLAAALRASHAKPWAQCVSGHERLDPYNGFLLVANLDSLFDKFLISFEDDGNMLIAPCISQSQKKLLGISDRMRLRKVHPRHIPYLRFHREKFMLSLKGI